VPVKLTLDRKEEHLVTGNRPSAAAKIKAGVSADGKITAFDAESWGTGGAGSNAGFPLPYIYHTTPTDSRRRAHKDVFINTGLQRPMRAPGHPQGSFITEIMMDELADLVKMDPIEFRIKNLPPEGPRTRCGAAICAKAPRRSAGASGIRPATRPRIDQDRHGRRDLHVGRRRPRSVARAMRDRLGRQRHRARRHAGHRHGPAHARRDRWRPMPSGCSRHR
jgi:CO/xanthine dehydrogenase Mo-binding subunit